MQKDYQTLQLQSWNWCLSYFSFVGNPTKHWFLVIIKVSSTKPLNETEVLSSTLQTRYNYLLHWAWLGQLVGSLVLKSFRFQLKSFFFQMLRSRGAAWREHRRHLVSKYFHFSFLCFESLSVNIVLLFLLLLVIGSLTLL
jgi:hypothetical protein